MYLGGATVREVADRYGLSISTLRRRLTDQGIDLRSYTGERKGTTPRPIDDQVRALADGSRSTREIATEIGVSEECVRRRMIRLGIPRLPGKARPERNHFWRGGRTIDKHGYVLVKSPDHPHRTAAGYVREHRLVMERVLGRYLERREVVHHIDGDPANNDPANLEVFASNHAHLAATLDGRVPNWTEDGRQRIAQGGRAANDRRSANRRASKNGGPQ